MRLNACWERWTCCRIAAVGRSVAQPGSAPVSGSGGRKFESYRSDHLNINSRAPRGVLFYAFNSHECLSHRILHRTLKASIPSRMSSTKERKRECLSLWSPSGANEGEETRVSVPLEPNEGEETRVSVPLEPSGTVLWKRLVWFSSI